MRTLIICNQNLYLIMSQILKTLEKHSYLYWDIHYHQIVAHRATFRSNGQSKQVFTRERYHRWVSNARTNSIRCKPYLFICNPPPTTHTHTHTHLPLCSIECSLDIIVAFMISTQTILRKARKYQLEFTGEDDNFPKAVGIETLCHQYYISYLSETN